MGKRCLVWRALAIGCLMMVGSIGGSIALASPDHAPTSATTRLVDTDNDGIQDEIDPDDDGDGILDVDENPGSGDSEDPDDGNQTDSDGDGIPDVLDPDDDNDGTGDDGSDGGPSPSDDADGDGIPDVLDPDDDNDGVTDEDEASSGNGPGTGPEAPSGSGNSGDGMVTALPVTGVGSATSSNTWPAGLLALATVLAIGLTLVTIEIRGGRNAN